MHKQQDQKEHRATLETIIEAVRSKKAGHIVDIDISKQSTTICRHFVICDAQSHVQVQAIADEVESQMSQALSTRAIHKEGYQNGIWVLLDYVDIVVHIFQHEARQFYNLEELWGDGKFTRYES